MPATKAKNNPGTFPVPQYVHDWIKSQRLKAGKKGSGPKIQWWPTPELTRDLCAEIAGGKSLTEVCKNNPDYPTRIRVLAWICQAREAKENPDQKKTTHPDILTFGERWDRACQLRLETDVDEMREIERRLATQPVRIQGKAKDMKGRTYPVLNPEAIEPHAARIVLESKRWRLSRELPERFGDRSKVEHSGSVKVERPQDHMPEWMRAQLEAEAGKTATDPAQPVDKKEEKRTVH